jgi:Glycosyltransferase Family 4
MNAAKKIIHVPRRFVAEEWGGTETVILEISRQQQRDGWSPEIYTSMALAKLRNETIGGVPVKRFPYCYPFFGLSAADKAALDKKGGNLLSLSLFNALRREKNVRLFHAHALKRLGGEIRTAARWQKKPFVVSLHGGVFDVPTVELCTMLKPIENKTEWGKPFGALFGSRRVLDASAKAKWTRRRNNSRTTASRICQTAWTARSLLPATARPSAQSMEFHPAHFWR